MTRGTIIGADETNLLPWSHVSERMAAAKHYWLATVGPGASNEKYGQDQEAADYEADEIGEFRPKVALAWNVLYEDATRWRL